MGKIVSRFATKEIVGWNVQEESARTIATITVGNVLRHARENTVCKLAIEVDVVKNVTETTVSRLADQEIHVAWNASEETAIKSVSNNAIWNVVEKYVHRIAMKL